MADVLVGFWNSYVPARIKYSKTICKELWDMSGRDQAQERKRYVEEVRRSFGQEEAEYQSGAPEGTSSFFKVRLLMAACIFIAFILCDQTGSRFYNYTTTEIVSMLQEERFQTQLDTIRETWNAMAGQAPAKNSK